MVDVAVTIPKACLYEKDHLDCKYHGKRVLWLAVVAFWLKKHAMFKQQEWALLNGDARQDSLASSLPVLSTPLPFPSAFPTRPAPSAVVQAALACLSLSSTCLEHLYIFAGEQYTSRPAGAVCLVTSASP